MDRNIFTNNWAKCGIICLALLFIAVIVLLDQHYKAGHARRLQERIKAEEAAVNAEVLRREAIAIAEHRRSATDDDAQTPVERINQSTDPLTTEPSQPTTETLPTDSVELVTSGPLKGMTVEAAKATARKHLEDSKAATRRQHEWNQRNGAASQRLIKLAEKRLAHSQASRKSADEELSAMLSAMALLSPEQLDYARQEILKTDPDADVDAFFNDIANATRKTPEELDKDVKKILSSGNTYDIVGRELDIESAQIDRELEEIKRTKP